MCVNLCANKKVLMERPNMSYYLWMSDPLAFWKSHYLQQHKMRLKNLSQALIPPKPKGDCLLICIPKGHTSEKEFMSWNFPKWKVQEDLSTLAHKNIRDSTETYFVWIIKSDKTLYGLSTKSADKYTKSGITLLERLVLQSGAKRAGVVVDMLGFTFCAGSRTLNGCVPAVGFLGGREVLVTALPLSEFDSDCGVRRVWA